MKRWQSGILAALTTSVWGFEVSSLAAGACEKDVEPLLTAMFSKLGNDCEAYAALYTPDAKYYHQHQGFKTGSELLAACQGYGSFCSEGGNACIFQQNGAATLKQRDGKCHILAPYIWSQIPADNKIPNNLEPHTGWEYMIAKPDSRSAYGYKIEYFAEIETSYSVPYNWAKPDATPALVQDSTLTLLQIERDNGIYHGECDTPIAPFLTSYFQGLSSEDQTWRQQGDAVVLGVGGLCQLAVPYAAQVGHVLKSGYMVFVLEATSIQGYKMRDVLEFPSTAVQGKL